jgi:GTP-binding protein
MKIRNVVYAGTIGAPGQEAPGALPQIAFSGRSNVGKSSLINTLLRRTRSKIAHVSATPGKTRALNFYRVNDRFFLVDLPGYGYARVPEAVRAAWTKLIDWYLGEAPGVRGVVHLVDARHAPTRHDTTMVAYLAELGIPALVVLTKVDKLKRSERDASFARALADLALAEEQMVPFSAKTGEGRDALLEALDGLLDDEETRTVEGPDSGTDPGEREDSEP